jgi:hypothetical protein
MNKEDKRLDKLFPALTAKERGILLLRALKRGERPNPLIRWTIPSDQVDGFNHYVDLLNGLNRELWIHTEFVNQMIQILSVRVAWLHAMELWAAVNASLGRYILLYTKEPILKSEYERVVQEAQEEMISVSELAEILVEEHEGWTASDLGPETGGDESVISDASWERIYQEKEALLRRLVREGTLVGKGRGSHMKIQAGSFYDWKGEPVPIFPDWGTEYEVFLDEEVEKVKSLSPMKRQRK